MSITHADNAADTDHGAPAAGLASTIDAAMVSGAGTLSVFDPSADRWERRPWCEVRERAAQIATWIRSERAVDRRAAIGLLGDPTVDLVAGVHAAWLTGSPVSILPGPIRGADEQVWAASTAARFAAVGVDIVLGGGPQLDLLAAAPGELRVELVDEIGIAMDTTGFVPTHLAPEDPAVLQGTAGSTGDPKTAVLSARAVATNTASLTDRLRIGQDDIGLSWLPLYHDMGLTFLLAGMWSGIPLLLAPNSTFAGSPFRWPQWLTESRVTVTAAPNFAYDIIGRYGRLLKDADLSALRVAISGGEPIDPDAFDRFLAVAAAVGFDRAAAAPAYGLAESTCAVTLPAAGAGARYDEVTVRTGADGIAVTRRYPLLGEPLVGMEIRVVEPDVDTPLVEGRDVGAVEIRGTSMMSGYLGHPPIDPTEWFPTGDLGYLVDGKLVICGRTKEIVIVAGRNLFPVEIERAAASVDGVRRGGVVAVARGEGSARPGLVVIAEHRGAQELSEVRAAISSAVASECGVRPTDVVLVEPGSMPRTTSGKLRRLAARALVESGEWA